MRILALDPGATKAGWAVYDTATEQVLGFGIFSAFISEGQTFNQNINETSQQAHHFFKFIMSHYGVTRVCWEVVPGFGGMGYRDRVLTVASALKSLVWENELQWTEVSPNGMKKLATGSGKAEKHDIEREVFRRIENFPRVRSLPVDVFDAVMIALVCHERGEWNEPLRRPSFSSSF